MRLLLLKLLLIDLQLQGLLLALCLETLIELLRPQLVLLPAQLLLILLQLLALAVNLRLLNLVAISVGAGERGKKTDREKYDCLAHSDLHCILVRVRVDNRREPTFRCGGRGRCCVATRPPLWRLPVLPVDMQGA